MPRRDARSRSSAVATRRSATDALLVDERGVRADHVARLARVDVGGQLVPLPGRDPRALGERRARRGSAGAAATSRAAVGSCRAPAAPCRLRRRRRAVAVTAFATASRVRSASRACSSARSFDVPTVRPRSSTARNVTRRCGGTRSRSKSAGSTGANVRRRIALRDHRGERLAFRAALGTVGQLGRDLRGPFGRGHDLAAEHLRQRAQQRGDELVAQAGHLPVEPVGAHARRAARAARSRSRRRRRRRARSGSASE